MAQKHWKKHGRQLLIECRKIWAWLRIFQEYRKDYRTVKKRVPPPYQIPLGSTIVSGPNQPADEYIENLRKRWGFYPLHNPVLKSLPDGFFEQMSKHLCSDYNEAGVRHRWFNYAHIMDWVEIRGRYEMRPKKNLPNLPNRITFEIDLKLPIIPALTYVKEFLNTVQDVYAIPAMRPNADKAYSRYKALTMSRLGIPERKISRALTPILKKEFPKSYRQAIERIMKEVKQLSQ